MDSMLSNRAYRKALNSEFVKEELKKFSGIQFDAKIVKVCLSLIDKMGMPHLLQLLNMETVRKN